MANTQYTFDTQPNDYFLGTDLRVTDGTEHTIIVNEKDGMLGVNVKDEQTVQDFPADVMEAWNRLPEQRRQQVYERVKGEYWLWVADLAQTYDFAGISQEGRDGGWLCVTGLGIDGGDLIDPGPGTEARDERDRFLAFAFEAERAIEDDWRGQLYEAFKQAAASVPCIERRFLGGTETVNLAEFCADVVQDDTQGERVAREMLDQPGQERLWNADEPSCVEVFTVTDVAALRDQLAAVKEAS